MPLKREERNSTPGNVRAFCLPSGLSIEGRTVPSQEMRYSDVGDWTIDAHGTRHYRVAELSNVDYEFLVLLHEMIECHLCLKRGITQEAVDLFDLPYAGDDPGGDPESPYHREHLFACAIERQVAQELGVDWDEYEKRIEQCAC